MLFLKRTPQPTEATNRIAGKIAGMIVRWQLRISAKLNRRINRYPAVRQRQLLWIFCAVSACAIIASLVITMHYLPMSAQPKHYRPAHIGQASDIPRPIPRPTIKTDSLTIKK